MIPISSLCMCCTANKNNTIFSGQETERSQRKLKFYVNNINSHGLDSFRRDTSGKRNYT